MGQFDDTQVLKKIVNRNFTFGDFNKYLNNTFNSNVFCPFHEHNYEGKGNAKLYYNEDEGYWVLHCFVKCGNLTTYDYVDRILIKRNQQYKSVQDFLIEKLGRAEFFEQYRQIRDNIDYLRETEYQEKKKYISNVYNEYDNVSDFIEALYTERDVGEYNIDG